MTSAPPPGWYDDVAGETRWWDGQKWGPARGERDPVPAAPPPTGTLSAPDIAPDAPVPSPPAQAGRGRLSWLIAGGAAVLIVVAAVVWTLVGRADGGSEAGSPEETVREFFAAFKAGSCEGVTAVVTERYIEESGSDCSEFEEHPGQMEGVELTLGEATTNSDGTVAVPIFLATEGKTPSGGGGFILVKVGDTWLIDDSW